MNGTFSQRRFGAAIMVLSLLIQGCSGNGEGAITGPDGAAEGQMFYGSVIELDGALDAAEMREILAESGRSNLRFEGEIVSTCPKKGCWMDVASGEDTVFVRFLDYGFFVPTDGAEGKKTTVEGEAFYDTLTVDMRRHYAEDAGASKEEIAAITEPELKLAFMATGVMIEDQ